MLSWLTWKRGIALAFLIAATVVITGASYVLDNRADQRRPMYREIVTMQQLQWDVLHNGEKPVLGHFAPHDPPVKIGRAEFRVHGHIHLDVEMRDDQVCVKGHNGFGEHSSWLCVDPKQARPQLGGLR